MKIFLIVAASLFTTTSFAGKKDCQNDKQFRNVSKAEMVKIVNTKSANIIDVNSKKSYDKKHIPGAFHYASNQKNLDKILPKDKNAPIIAYCGGEMCTAWKKAARAACEKGYTNIRHFSAGINGWSKKI